MIGDQDAFAEFFLSRRLPLQVFDRDGVDAAEGFIQQNQFGIGDQGAGDFQFSAFAAAEGVGLLVALLDQAILLQKCIGLLDGVRPADSRAFRGSPGDFARRSVGGNRCAPARDSRSPAWPG